MPTSVVGQLFDVVSCQACEQDLSFQQASTAKRIADNAQDLEITCRVCGHLGIYRAANMRQTQAQYPL
jgi:predicted RNA-binding Zn-ribbon protein involved in translation (DUF1610 family)